MSGSYFSSELEANRYTVEKILAQAKSGRLRVPPFQRPLRWRRKNHLLLLDSLYRGFPIGTLLLWHHRAPKAIVRFGSFLIEAPEREDALWIVDGQQRMNSLLGSLLFPGDLQRHRRDELAIMFDPRTDEFIPTPTDSDGLIPVNRLADPVDTSQWASEVGASAELHRRAQEIGNRLRSYEVPAYVTHAQSDDVLRTVFERSNTAGTAMRDTEVFEALNRGIEEAREPASLTLRLKTSVIGLRFGAPDDDLLQRALVAVSGHNPRSVLPDALRAPGKARSWEEPTILALHRTVTFLREEVGIPHVRLLPSELPLVILPLVFHRFPSPRERSIELLVRWVWRGIAGNVHAATNEHLTQAFNAVKDVDEEAAVQGLLKYVPRTEPQELPESTVFNRRGMPTRLELCALWSLGSVDLRTGEALDLPDLLEPSDTEDQDTNVNSGVPRLRSPLPDLASIAPSDLSPDRRRLVSSRFLHAAIPGSPKLFNKLLQSAEATRLETHAIPSSLLPLVREGNWNEVVDRRRRVIRDLVRAMVIRRARWAEDDDGPSLEATLDEAEREDAA